LEDKICHIATIGQAIEFVSLFFLCSPHDFFTLARTLLMCLTNKTDFKRGNAQAKEQERRRQTVKKSTLRKGTSRQ